MNANKTHWTEETALNLLRIVAGFLFWAHGAQKLFGILGGQQVGEFFSMMGLAGILEFVGGILLVTGLFTRATAFVLSGQMAWAYFMVHAPQGFWPIQNNGELAALYSFLFLYVAARGGGSFSLDGMMKRRKSIAEGAAPGVAAPPPADRGPELTEEDLAEDPEVAELLGDDEKKS